MPKTPSELTLTQLTINEIHNFWAIRLVKANNKVVLFDAVLTKKTNGQGYNSILSATSFDSLQTARKIIFSIPQLLPVAPIWDVISNSKNQYLCVIEQAGGAINKLAFVDESGLISAVTEHHQLESFSSPRFIKDQRLEATFSISTVIDQNDFVVFPENNSENKMEAIKLGNWSDGIILPFDKGYMLIVKRIVSGHERNGILPGIIETIRLNDKLQIIYESVKPMAENIVYEFDADHVSIDGKNSHIALFATGLEKPILTVSNQFGNFVNLVPLKGSFDKMKLAKPSVLFINNKINIAVIENLHTSDAKLFIGAIVVNL